MAGTYLTTLRKRLLKQRDIDSLAPATRKPLTIEETPDLFPKTAQMKLIEMKLRIKIEREINKGSIYDVAARWKVNPATISKWRSKIRKYLGSYSFG